MEASVSKQHGDQYPSIHDMAGSQLNNSVKAIMDDELEEQANYALFEGEVRHDPSLPIGINEMRNLASGIRESAVGKANMALETQVSPKVPIEYVSGAGQRVSRVRGEIDEIIKAPELPKYAENVPTASEKNINAKGINVEFYRPDGTFAARAKLVNWTDPDRFLVIERNKGKFFQHEVNAEKLGVLNPNLAQEIARTHNEEGYLDSLTSIYDDFKAEEGTERMTPRTLKIPRPGEDKERPLAMEQASRGTYARREQDATLEAKRLAELYSIETAKRNVPAGSQVIIYRNSENPDPNETITGLVTWYSKNEAGEDIAQVIYLPDEATAQRKATQQGITLDQAKQQSIVRDVTLKQLADLNYPSGKVNKNVVKGLVEKSSDKFETSLQITEWMESQNVNAVKARLRIGSGIMIPSDKASPASEPVRGFVQDVMESDAGVKVKIAWESGQNAMQDEFDALTLLRMNRNPENILSPDQSSAQLRILEQRIAAAA